MSLLNIARRIIFWSLDFIKGSPIRNHYNEINQILSNTNSKKSTERRNELLNNLLNHAVNSAPFYSKYKTYNSLHDFPVINKILIQENFNSFKSIAYLNKKQYLVSTSGSTGIPFQLFQNKNKRSRNTADVIYFSQQSGYIIGQKVYFLEAWRHTKKKIIKSKIQNIEYVDISIFETRQIDVFLKRLSNNLILNNIIGLPSALEKICKHMDNQTFLESKKLKINSIITVSEYLSSYVKENLEKHFNTKVVSRYSNEEMGILAQQSNIEQNNAFNINWASYYVEILKMDTNEKANLGELGRIVITDLFNSCMPLIRYDTGDIGAFEIPNTTHKFYKLKTIEGRKMDFLYDTKGTLISPHLIHNLFNKYFHLLKQYQFIQEGENEYTVKLNIHNEFPNERKFIEEIKKDFGNDANIKIIYVNGIPTLSSGKQQKVLNLWHTHKKIS